MIVQPSLKEIQDRLDEKLEPISITTGKKIEMQAKVAYDPERIGKNVLAMIPGSDPDIGNEVVILGGHLDHLGIEYGDIYNGADDNASGVSVILEIARTMSANQLLPRRTILFACWGGEERGLLGSYHYCKYPVLPLENTVLNFNIDMVGIGEKLCLAGIYLIGLRS